MANVWLAVRKSDNEVAALSINEEEVKEFVDKNNGRYYLDVVDTIEYQKKIYDTKNPKEHE